MDRYTVLDISVGSLILLVTPYGLARVIITSKKKIDAVATARKLFPHATADPHLWVALQRQLIAYFNGKQVDFDIQTDLTRVTDFQRRILTTCAKIRYGRQMTYGELASNAGYPGAARAVGNTMAKNPIPIVIPCHRVVGAHGHLGGFSAEQGIALKRWLLDMEQNAIMR